MNEAADEGRILNLRQRCIRGEVIRDIKLLQVGLEFTQMLLIKHKFAYFIDMIAEKLPPEETELFICIG